MSVFVMPLATYMNESRASTWMCVCVCVSDCRIGYIHVMLIYMCVCGQEREFIMPSATLVRASAPDRGIGKQLWDLRVRVDNEAKQSIDFKNRKWEFPNTTKVRDANRY